jgi:hypothetical protein
LTVYRRKHYAQAKWRNLRTELGNTPDCG